MKSFSLRQLTLWASAAVAVLIVASALRPPRETTDFPLTRFGDLPTVASGRLKPLSTEARHALLLFSGKQTWKDGEGKRQNALRFMADLILAPDRAKAHEVFRIDHHDLKSLLISNPGDRKIFSYAELEPHLDSLRRQLESIPEERARQSVYDRALGQLMRSVDTYLRLQYSVAPFGLPLPVTTEYERFVAVAPAGLAAMESHQRGTPADPETLHLFMIYADRYRQLGESAKLSVVPPADPAAGLEGWTTVGRSLLTTGPQAGVIDPAVAAWATLADAWRAGDPAAFGRGLDALEARRDAVGVPSFKLWAESYFHRVSPFTTAAALYVLVFLLALGAWVINRAAFAPAAYAVLVLTAAVHTFGIVARIWIEARPPVTNLYSSAVFVGWGAVLVALVLERLHRVAVASAMASILGFCTLLIAHHLSLGGDTMEVMRAVLNSNFWLATHVVVVTLGYSATFAAGGLAMFQILLGLTTRGFDPKTASVVHGATYGVICFALLFSFVGTILGGIWADQSWGRFWGWDPKENGAAMIVLWNAVIVHARWGGLVRKRGFAMLAVFGNIITAWSWFGTNLLGVGLHAYGFTDNGFLALTAFVASQIVVMLLAAIPVRHWRSPAAAT